MTASTRGNVPFATQIASTAGSSARDSSLKEFACEIFSWVFDEDVWLENSSGYSLYRYNWLSCHFLLGAFAKLRNATVIFAVSSRLFALKNSASNGRIFMKFVIWLFFENVAKSSKFYLKSVKNNSCFTWTPTYIYGDIVLNSSKYEKCFRKSRIKNRYTHLIFNTFFQKSCH
jgi:hypothetical protein